MDLAHTWARSSGIKFDRARRYFYPHLWPYTCITIGHIAMYHSSSWLSCRPLDGIEIVCIERRVDIETANASCLGAAPSSTILPLAVLAFQSHPRQVANLLIDANMQNYHLKLFHHPPLCFQCNAHRSNGDDVSFGL